MNTALKDKVESDAADSLGNAGASRTMPGLHVLPGWVLSDRGRPAAGRPLMPSNFQHPKSKEHTHDLPPTSLSRSA